MDEATSCREKLTRHTVYKIHECPHHGPNGNTWMGFGGMGGAPKVSKDISIGKDKIITQIKRLDDEGPSVEETKNSLSPYQLEQLLTCVDDIISKDPEGRTFEWSLDQLKVDKVQTSTRSPPQAMKRKSKDSRAKPVKALPPTQEEYTVSMTLFLRRAPSEEMDPILLCQKIQEMRLENFGRPPPPPPPPQKQSDKDTEAETSEQGGPLSQPMKEKISRKTRPAKSSGTKNTKNRTPRRRSSAESLSPDSCFDTASSDGSSTWGWGSRKKSSKPKQRGSRDKERGSRPFISSSTPPSHPFDPVAAAYQVGRADAEAEAAELRNLIPTFGVPPIRPRPFLPSSVPIRYPHPQPPLYIPIPLSEEEANRIINEQRFSNISRYANPRYSSCVEDPGGW